MRDRRAEIIGVEQHDTLNHFERIIRPKRLAGIKTGTIDEYVAARRVEPNRKNGQPVSPATINKELRTIRAVLRKAVRWGYLARAPEFEFLREPGRLITYLPPEDFGTIYAACDAARWPDGGLFSPADWWRGLLVMAYMTGWRIGGPAGGSGGGRGPGGGYGVLPSRRQQGEARPTCSAPSSGRLCLEATF